MPNQNEIIQRFAALEARADHSEQSLTKTRRQLRVTWAVSSLAALVAFATGWHKDALAQGYGITLAQAATRIAALETKTASMSVVAANDSTNTSGQSTVRFSGVNVQIVSGAGGTQTATNGTGNLIIGYNELRGSGNTRTGSHNVVVGLYNNYSSYGGAVVGFYNTISGEQACVLSGSNNTASNSYSSVLSGRSGTASGTYSSISGGDGNTASDFGSSISGGIANTASGYGSSISGGIGNTASSNYSSVSGGGNNTAGNDFAAVSGGHFVRQNSLFGFAAGGNYPESMLGAGTFHSP